MHNRFLDKKRRYPSLRLAEVKNVLPEHFASYYPKFIKLLESYYNFQDANDSTELLNHLFASRDINETDITLLTYIEDELLLGEAYFQGFGNSETELRAAANFSNTLFRSKGTKFAIEWFFRSFYDTDVEVIYTKENIFNIGDSLSTIGADSLRYLTDDKLYQTFALLIRAGVPISTWREVFKLFAHPAGMYLGGEVSLTDITSPDLTLTEYISELDPSPSYSLGSTASAYGELSGSEEETGGTAFNIIVTGSNINNGFTTGLDGVYWYGTHGNTTDSDFGVNSYSNALGLPDSNNPQYIDIFNSVGAIPIQTVIDKSTNPLELNEWFSIRLETQAGEYLDSAKYELLNVEEAYNLNFQVASNILQEGNTYEVLVTGNYIPNNGNTNLKWYFDPLQSDNTFRDSDFYTWYQNPNPYSKWQDGATFVGLPDSAGIGTEFTLTDGMGSFTLDPRVDGLIPPTESVAGEIGYITIANTNGVVVGGDLFSILPTTPVLSVQPIADLVEGNNLNISVVTGSYNIGKQLNYVISGDITTETSPRITDTVGSFTVAGVFTTVSIPVSATDTYSGSTSGTFTVTDPNITTAVIQTSGNFNILDLPATYVLGASITPGIEGSPVTYQVTGANIPDGTDVWFYINGIPPDDADPTIGGDWTIAMPQAGSRQQITISNNIGLSPEYTYNSADGVEDPEYYEVHLFDAVSGGTELTINPLSRTILATPINITLRRLSDNATVSTIDETVSGASAYRFEIAATGLADGDYSFYLQSVSGYYGATEFVWDDTNQVAENINYPTLANPAIVTITSSAGALEFYATQDVISEGTETFKFVFAQEIDGSLSAISEFTFDVTDTSQAQYTITAPTFTTEADIYSVSVTPTDIANAIADGSDILYFELSGAAATEYTTTQKTESFQSSDQSILRNVQFVTNGDDQILEADRAGTLHVTRGDYNSGSPAGTVFTQAFTLTDAGVTAVSFTASPDVFDEGNSTVFTWTGSNIADQTKYWIRPTSMYSGTGTIQANNTTMSSVSPSPTTTFAALGYVVGDELTLYMEVENNIAHEFNGRRVISWDANSITFDGTSPVVEAETKSFYIAPKETWDYFLFTTVLNSEPIETAAGGITYDTGNGNGQLTVLSTSNTSLNDGVFEYGLYVNFNDTSPIATEQITITNTNTGATVDLSLIAGTTLPLDLNGGTAGVHPYAVNSYGSNPGNSASATAAMRFYPDGSYRTLNYSEGQLFNDYTLPVGGTWATGNTGDGSGYWINVTTSGSTDINYSINGSTGVWLELNVVDGRAFGVTATANRNSENDPPQQDIKSAELTIRVVQANSAAEAQVAYAASNSNKDTKVSIVRARAATVELF